MARAVVMVLVASVLVPTVGLLAPVPAEAAGTILFQNAFNNRTVDGTGTVTLPTPVSGANQACLTASGNSSTQPLLSCASAPDAQGGGKLRLTAASGNQVGAVFGQTSFPTSSGLDVTFNSYQWGGNSADGIAFMLAAVDPASPVAPTQVGSSGGALGYSAAPGVDGLTNAYLGVGLDVFGNFSSPSYQGTGCSNPTNISATTPGAVVVRGPGNRRVGYCGLTTSYTGSGASTVTLRASTRAASAVPVQVLINPTAVAFTSDSGVSVSAGTYKVRFTPVGKPARTLSGTLPSVAAGLYPSASWLNASGVPKQLAFGFVGSTGGSTDVHEVSDAKVLTFNPVAQLGVDTTSYSAATSQPGEPVTYTATASVQAGANVANPITLTQTVPVGVVPVGAYGTGWVCQAPVGQTVACTTSASSFTNGTALPAVTVNAVVTTADVTSATIQSGSPTGVSSADSSPGTDALTTLGTLPTAPSSVTVTPAIGAVAGGGTVTVGGTNITAATAIEIGTTAQQQAGTPVTLMPCPGAAAVGCFTVSGSTLVISSMPARTTAATTSVTVVTLGVADAASYVYADRPAVPAAPTVTAGTASATVTWAAPASNGSAITGYVVTPYLAGVAQTPVSYDASTTTRTLSSLTVGGSYTFTVAATNAYGTSAASAASAAAVPYTVPGTPTITAATAGDSRAVLTWTAPSNGGSAITGYVVTPYIGLVAQAPQTFTGAGTTQAATGLTPGTAYTFTVAAQNAAGTGPPSAKSSAVTPNESPSLVFAAPPAGEVGVAYSRQLTVTNGTGPFVWSVSSGSLPAGLTLGASTGLLSGTPTASGSFAVTIQVVDASLQTATKAVTLVIAAVPVLAFTPTVGEVSVAYSYQPTVTGGTGPFTWAVTAGSLPAGLTVNASTGLISGTPTAAGNYSVTLAATDSFNQVATKTATLVVLARPAFGTTPPPSGQVGTAYSTTFDVTGGASPLTWSITSGTLPAGLALASSYGVVSGTPTTAGSSSFTVSVVDSNGQSASRSVTLTITAGPLVVTKTANVSSVAPGGTVAYTITIANTGATSRTGVVVSDPLGGVLDDATYNGNATATTGSVTYTAPTIGWTGNLAAGATATINYSVTVANPGSGNKVLANTVTSSTLGTNCASGSGDARCTATVTVSGLTIVKTADAATTTPGSTVRFTIVVTNTGQTPYIGATLTDSLAGVLDDAAYNADAGATSGQVSFDSPSLTWTGNLAVGASATITYSATVANPDNGNRSLSGTIVSPSAGSPCPSGNPGPTCTATVTVLVPALSIATSANVTTTTPGGVVAYTLTLSNTGQTPYTGATVNLALAAALDDATFDANASATAGSVAFNAGTGSLVWTGNLAIAQTVVVTASVTVRSPDPGDKVLTTVATSAAAGSTCPVGGTNPACTTTVQVRVPQLSIVTSANASTANPGGVVSYTTTVTNTGQTPYTGASFAIALAGVLDDATYAGGAATTAGTVGVVGGTLTWTGDLAIGATATITHSVTVDDPDEGDGVLDATVTSSTTGNNCPSGASDPNCRSTVSVLVPEVSIDIAADATSTTPGGVVRYDVTVLNTGETSYTDLAVTLDLAGALDDADYNYDASITTGDLVTNPDGTVDWVLDLAPGASAVGAVSLTAKSPATGDRSLSVIVVSNSPGSNCVTGSTDPACVSVLPILLPGLTITKTANAPTVTPGGTVEYTISVVNDGETPYPAATFDDDLSGVLFDAVYAGDASATTGTVSYSAPVLRWTGALAPGASATITYSVTVRDPDPGDKTMTNAVVSSSAGTNCAQGSTDARCTAVVRVLVPALTIVKTADAATTLPGATVGYTVVVTNSGATPFTGATFTDSLGGVLDDADYNADAAATSGSVGVSGSALTWTGNLAVGATATVTYSVGVHTADDGNDLLVATIISTTAGSNCPSGGTDPRCTVTVPVARLDLAQTSTESSVTPGSVVHLTSTVTNTGQVPYTGITVSLNPSDVFDDATPNGDQSATSGTLGTTATTVTWTGNVPVGGVVTVSRSVTVRNPDPGNKVITARLQTTAPGSNCPVDGSATRCAFVVTVVVPQLTIAKVADRTAVVPGGTVAYTITAANTGQTPYSGATVADSLAGVLDKATYNDDAATTSGAVTLTSSVLTWTGDLAVGATATITYSVTVASAPPADKAMVNTVSSSDVGSTCPPASGATACRSIVAILTPALTIVKTADQANATLGSTVTYTVTATNSGQVPFAAAEFTDPLAGALDDAAYDTGSVSATSGTAGFSTGVVSWFGALNPGASATVTYSMTIDNPAEGDGVLTNTVASTTPGSNCPSGAGDSRCTANVTVTNAVSLTFTKTAGVTSTVAGATVGYTVTVVNSSELPVVDATFTDPLDGILDDAVYNADAAASSGSVGYSAPDLTWTGTLAGLSTVTVTYSVTVDSPVTGDQRLTGTVSSTSLLSSNNCIADSIDPRCTNTVTVAGLLLEQHYTETATTPGSVVHLSATFTNTGQTPYTGITVAAPSGDTVDDAIPVGDQAATSGTLVLGASAITWTGNIPVGGEVTVTGTLTVKDPATGNRLLTGTLVTAAPGSNCPPEGSDPLCTSLLPVELPGLTITKSADTTFVVPGGTVGYTITVENTGETPYTGATVTDSLAGILDDATYNADAGASVGVVSYTSPTLTWTGDLASGASATITYSATARSPAAGDNAMVNIVTSTASGSTCPPASGNTACRSAVEVRAPALAITSTADAGTTVPGATVAYTLTVENTGQVSYTAASVDAPLAGLLDDAGYNADASATVGTVALVGETLTWTGSLAPDDTATITYTVTVDEPVAGDFRLAQTVTSAEQGSTCPASTTDPNCITSIPIASLQIVNTADVSTAKPTSVVRNTVTFTNVGQVPYVGISIADSFVGTVDDATYNGDAEVDAGSLVLDLETASVVWTGDIAVGATVTLTGSLTVNLDPGDKQITSLVTTDAPATNCPTAAPGPACTSTVVVLNPGLNVSKVADTVVAAPGGDVGYTITIANTGETPYTAATVTDSLTGVLQDASYNGDAVATSGSVTFAGQTLTWTGDLAIGATVTVTYGIEIDDPDLGGKILVNRVASDELGSTCPAGGPDPACSTFVFVLVSQLDLTLTSDASTAVPGGTVSYTITVHNEGQTNYAGATVTAQLDGVLDDSGYGGDATATAGTVTLAGGAIVWTGDVPQDATRVITYAVTVNDPDLGDRQLVTTVSSDAPGSHCHGGGTQCVNTVDVLIPGLAISTTADVATATPGDVVTFTIAVGNTGETPYAGAVVETDLGDIVDDAVVGVTINASVGVATYTAPTLSWTGTLPVGASATISYTATVRDPDPGDRSLSTTVVSATPGSTCPEGGDDPACTATVAVLVPELTITKSADQPTTTPGGTVTYTIVIANSGETAYDDAVVDDSLRGVLPDSDYNGDAAVQGGGALEYADEVLTWTGDLAVEEVATINYSITVDDPDPGDKHMVNTVTSAAPGSTCPPIDTPAACTIAVDVLVPALTIAKTADTTTVVAGSPVAYTITVTNTGETAYAPATFTDALTGVLDDATYDGDAAATTGDLDYTDGTLLWTGALDVGASATVTYTVTTTFPAGGDRLLANSAISPSPGANCTTATVGDDPSCTAAVTVLVPALDITKAAASNEVVAGGTLEYTISATNTGEADYPDIVLTDSLEGVLDDAAYNADAIATAGTLEYSAGTLTWNGALPQGATVVITYSVTADLDDVGDAVMTNQVTSTATGSACLTGGLEPACTTSTAVAARTITLTDLTPSFTLAGATHSTVRSDEAVTLTVATNSPSGYVVTVTAATPSLTGSAPGNTDTIPIEDVRVRESGTTAFLPLSADTPVVVHQQDSPTPPGGDAVSNDYEVDIPFVAPDEYTASLDYIVSTQ